MPRLMFACFLLGGLLPEPGPTDYCATSYCAAGLTNVGCNPPPLTGGPNCDGKDAVVVVIGQEEIDHILDKLNTLRASFASGAHGPTFPTASRMPTLQWDAELATQAGHNARSCSIERDQCRNTAKFLNSGQSLAWSYPPFPESTSETLSRLIQSFLSEENNFVEGSYSYRSFSSANYYGHLANVINDRSSKVGCALQLWYFSYNQLFYLVCNFSDNLVDGEPIYTEGDTGSECISTPDWTYFGLCGI